MKTNVLPVLHTRVLSASTLIINPVSISNRIRTGNPVYLPGNNWVEGVDGDLTGVKLLLSPSDCAQFVTGRVSPVVVTGQMDFCVQGVVKNSNCVAVIGQDCFVTRNVETGTQSLVYYPVVNYAPFAGGSPQKKGIIPEHQRSIKSVKGVFCVNQLSSVQNVTNVPLVVPNPPVGSRFHEFWEKWAALGHLPQGYISPQGRLHPTLPVQTLPDQKTHNNKLLYRSSQE